MASDALDPLFLSFQLAVAGRYSIEREIGRGGMGVVFLAREVHLDRPVAIKVLPPDRAMHRALRDRFVREAQLAAKLSHPNIIPIHAVDESGELVYYVMPFIDGESLAARVSQRGPLPSAEGTRILRDVALALAHAHAHGVVHRDVKPDNILIERATGRILVADFGIAAAVQDTTGEVAGTPEFMSPEQALGREVGASSDIYSLGITAYYAFSGRLPFEGATPTELVAKHVTATPAPLASAGTSVARRVASLVDRCMAKEPSQRPASAESIAERLSVALEQKRELPVALRLFVREHGRMTGAELPLGLVGSVALGTAVTSMVGYQPEATLYGFLTVGVGYLVLPAVLVVRSARRLLASGFRHADLAGAFKSEIETAREERAMEDAGREGATVRFLEALARSGKRIAVISAVVAMVPATVWAFWSRFFFFWNDVLFTVLSAGFMYGVGAYIIGRTGTFIGTYRRDDTETRFWERLWTGRVGRAVFAIAERLSPNTVVKAAMTHRPTELSLGMAVESLLAALPKETRTQLGDVPSVVARLQEDAQRLRGMLEDVEEALADVDDHTAEHAEIREHRDAVKGKLQQAVSALETIRLNLLRLHAGAGSVQSFTTHLGSAAEINADVERLVAAQRAVDESLREFPRGAVATPV